LIYFYSANKPELGERFNRIDFMQKMIDRCSELLEEELNRTDSGSDRMSMLDAINFIQSCLVLRVQNSNFTSVLALYCKKLKAVLRVKLGDPIPLD